MTTFEHILSRIVTYRNWLFLTFPLNRIFKPFIQTRKGNLTIEADLFTGEFAMVHEEFYRDDYQLQTIKLPLNPVVFDVGANIGSFSLWASVQYPTATIYSFEPASYIQEKLRGNLSRNNVKGAFYSVALGSQDGIEDFYLSKDTFNSSLIKENAGILNGVVEKVAVKTLSSLMKEIGVEKIDLLKLDIEGGEYEVLLNLSSEIFDKIDNLVLEVHSSPKKDALLNLLRTHFVVTQSASHEKVFICTKK